MHQLNGAKGRGINPLNYVVWSNLARALTHPAQSGPCRWKRQSRSAPLSHPAPEWSVLLYFSSTVKSTRAPRFLPCKTRSLDMSVSASTQPRPQLHLREPTQKFDVSVSVRTIQFLHPILMMTIPSWCRPPSTAVASTTRLRVSRAPSSPIVNGTGTSP